MQSEYEDLWGEGSIHYSEQVLTSYVSHYATSARLGHVPTDEDIARIHHGGPDGWRDNSTLSYWRKVSEAMNSTDVGKFLHVIGLDPARFFISGKRA